MDPIRMHLNESPFEPSKQVSFYVSKYINRLNLYHLEELEREFMEKLSSYVGLPEENLLVFPGSSEALISVIRYCRHKGLKLITVWPSFHGLAEFAQMEGVPLGRIGLTSDSFELDLVRLARESGPGRALYLANPNNPTSNMLFEDLETLEFLLSRYGLVIVDEAYFEFSNFTITQEVKNHENLVVVRTFSKAFSLAGARIGYVAVSEKMAEELGGFTAAFSASIMSLAAAFGALEDLDYMRRIVGETIKLREELRKSLLKLGFHTIDSKTNFLFVKTPVTGNVVARELKNRGIKVKAYDDEVIKNYIRISVSYRENNLALLKALSDILRN